MLKINLELIDHCFVLLDRKKREEKKEKKIVAKWV